MCMFLKKFVPGRCLVILGLMFSMAVGCGGSTESGEPLCTSDRDCESYEFCNSGTCTPFGGDQIHRSCTVDADCRDKELCLGGICVAGSDPDGGDADPSDNDELPDADGGTGEDDFDNVDGGDQMADQQADNDLPQPQINLAGDVTVFEDSEGRIYEINYGNVFVGTPVERQLVIGNLGEATLEVSVVTINNDEHQEFSLLPVVPPALSIEPGEEQILLFRYQAQDGLTDRAVAKIFSNDPDQGEIPVQLVSEFKGDARIYLDPVALNFGEVAEGQADTQALTIANRGSGNAVLRIDSVAPEVGIETAYTVIVEDPDDGSEISLPAFINPGESITAQVTFTAPARGHFNGNLVILNSDPASTTATVLLEAAAGIPKLFTEPETLAFGPIAIGTAAPAQTLILRNQGVGDLTINGIELAATSSADITLHDLPAPLPAQPVVIAPGGHVSVSLHYTPLELGTDMATVLIDHDAPDPGQQLQLLASGEGYQGNAKPKAVILADGVDTVSVSVALHDSVQLLGSDSFDVDGSITEYLWRIVDQPVDNPCGLQSSLAGTISQNTSIVLHEAGVTTIGLMVKDDQDTWSDEDLLQIIVASVPEAYIDVDGNDTGYIEVDQGETLTFDGRGSSDCDGVITDWQWSMKAFPAKRLTAPILGGGPDTTSVLFDFPGYYTIGLVVVDSDSPTNESALAQFDVLVRGPRGFRVTVDWFDRGQDDQAVDVDLHMLKPGSTNFFGADDCCPYKELWDGDPAEFSCSENTDWGIYGQPIYEDTWEDDDAAEPPNPLLPSDVISHTDPAKGDYELYVFFRCHSSTNDLSIYVCCDDGIWPCPFGLSLCQDDCGRIAEGIVIYYVTDFDGQETEVARKGFLIQTDKFQTLIPLGKMVWPEGIFVP